MQELTIITKQLSDLSVDIRIITIAVILCVLVQGALLVVLLVDVAHQIKDRPSAKQIADMGVALCTVINASTEQLQRQLRANASTANQLLGAQRAASSGKSSKPGGVTVSRHEVMLPPPCTPVPDLGEESVDDGDVDTRVVVGEEAKKIIQVALEADRTIETNAVTAEAPPATPRLQETPLTRSVEGAPTSRALREEPQVVPIPFLPAVPSSPPPPAPSRPILVAGPSSSTVRRPPTKLVAKQLPKVTPPPPRLTPVKS